MSQVVHDGLDWRRRALAKGSEALGWSLDAVAASTHIPERYLEALEAGRFHDLPGPAYVKGFLRNYAVHLGLPADELVQEIEVTHAELAGAQAISCCHPSEQSTASTRSGYARGVTTWLVLIVVISAGYLTYAMYGAHHRPARSPQPAHGAGVVVLASRTPAGAGAGAASPAGHQVQTGAPSNHGSYSGPASPLAGMGTPILPTSTAAASSHGAPPTPAAPSAGTPTAPGGSASGGTTTSAGSAAGTTAMPGGSISAAASVTTAHPAAPRVTTNHTITRPVASNSVQVDVVTTGQAWVRAVVDGRAVYDGVLDAGDRKSWEGQREVILSTTNAGAVDVAINGRSLGRLGNTGQIVERSFAPASPVLAISAVPSAPWRNRGGGTPLPGPSLVAAIIPASL